METIQEIQHLNTPASSQSKLYHILGYAGLSPFLYGTFMVWCGPMEKQLPTAELFVVCSILLLGFIAGTWWGSAFSENSRVQRRITLSSYAYALFTLGCWMVGNLPVTVLLLGFGYIAIWLHEFFIPISNNRRSYQVMRTLMTLTIFVCHLLVAAQTRLLV